MQIGRRVILAHNNFYFTIVFTSGWYLTNCWSFFLLFLFYWAWNGEMTSFPYKKNSCRVSTKTMAKKIGKQKCGNRKCCVYERFTRFPLSRWTLQLILSSDLFLFFLSLSLSSVLNNRGVTERYQVKKNRCQIIGYELCVSCPFRVQFA